MAEPKNAPLPLDNPEDDLRGGDYSDLDSALADLGGLDETAFVLASKWDEKAGSFARLKKYPVSGFDSMRVAEEFGAGKYQFRVYERGKLRLQRAILFGSPANVPGAPGTAPVPAPAAGGISPSDLLANMMQFQQNMLLALIPALAGKGGGGVDLAGISAILREAREAAGPPPAPPQTPIETMREMFELGLDVANGGKREDGENGAGGLLALAPRALSLFENIMQRAPVAAGAGARPAAQLAPAAPVDVPPATPEDRRLMALRQFAPNLLVEARAGHDPGTLADYLAPRISGELKDSLLQLVQLPPEDRRAALLAAEPALETYLPWIEDAATAFRENWLGTDDGEGASADSAP